MGNDFLAGKFRGSRLCILDGVLASHVVAQIQASGFSIASTGAPLFRHGRRSGAFDQDDFPIGLALERRSIFTELLAAPPIAGFAFGVHAGEPILINDGADLSWRRAVERIAGEKLQSILRILQQALLGPENKAVILPAAKRGKPQIPVE